MEYPVNITSGYRNALVKRLMKAPYLIYGVSDRHMIGCSTRGVSYTLPEFRGSRKKEFLIKKIERLRNELALSEAKLREMEKT